MVALSCVLLSEELALVRRVLRRECACVLDVPGYASSLYKIRIDDLYYFKEGGAQWFTAASCAKKGLSMCSTLCDSDDFRRASALRNCWMVVVAGLVGISRLISIKQAH